MSEPNYPELVKFLVHPFLDKPDQLKVDCEYFRQNSRVWVRLALGDEDRDRLLSRGARQLQTLRRVLAVAAVPVNQSVFVELYASETERSTPLRRRRSSAGPPPVRRPRSLGSPFSP